VKILHALGVSIGLLVAVWVYVSIGLPGLKLYPWIGFVAWAAFYAAGGGSAGVIKPLGASAAGVGLTVLTMYAVGQAGGGLVALIVLVAVLAFVLVAIADIGTFSYTPAAFLGAATYFGSGAKLDDSIIYVLLSWIAGLLLGYASEALGKKIARPAEAA
jgi:hypothetical protein